MNLISRRYDSILKMKFYFLFLLFLFHSPLAVVFDISLIFINQRGKNFAGMIIFILLFIYDRMLVGDRKWDEN